MSKSTVLNTNPSMNQGNQDVTRDVNKSSEVSAFPGLNRDKSGTYAEMVNGNQQVTEEVSFTDRVKGKKPHMISFYDYEALPDGTTYNGEPALEIPCDLAKEGIDMFEHSLIGRLNFNGLKLTQVKKDLEAQWQFDEDRCKLTPLTRGYFIIKLSSMEDKEHVWHGGCWTIGKQVLRVQNFYANFDPERQATSRTTVWVSFPGLFIELWTKKILTSLAKLLGRPVAIDQKTLDHDFGNFAAVLIDIDFAKPIPRRIWIKANGREFWQPVYIKGIEDINFCTHCKIMGHVFKDCNVAKKMMGVSTSNSRIEAPRKERQNAQQEWKEVGWKHNRNRVNGAQKTGNIHGLSNVNSFDALSSIHVENIEAGEIPQVPQDNPAVQQEKDPKLQVEPSILHEEDKETDASKETSFNIVNQSKTSENQLSSDVNKKKDSYMVSSVNKETISGDTFDKPDGSEPQLVIEDIEDGENDDKEETSLLGEKVLHGKSPRPIMGNKGMQTNPNDVIQDDNCGTSSLTKEERAALHFIKDEGVRNDFLTRPAYRMYLVDTIRERQIDGVIASTPIVSNSDSHDDYLMNQNLETPGKTRSTYNNRGKRNPRGRGSPRGRGRY